MDRRILIGIAVGAVAVALVAGTLLMNGNRPPAGNAASAKATNGESSGSKNTGAVTSGSLPNGATSPQRAAAQNGPAVVVTKPEPLKTVTQPPSETLAMIDATKATAGAKYIVTFVPYGAGPGAADSALVIRVDSAKPVGTVAKPFELKGHNMLVETTALPKDQQVTKGGRYSGTVTLEKRDTLLIPVLSDVSPR